MKVTCGVSEIATGCGLCTTAVGCIQGIPLIVFGTNMAFEGIQDLWYTLRGELDHESKNLIKEATGHKVDNLVELAEIGMSIYSGKVASKKITGKLGEESEKLSGLLKKTRKPVSIATRAKRLVKKFMPKKRYRKFKVVDVEELAKKQCLKPNIQLFAEDAKWDMPKKGKYINGRYYTCHALERMAPDTLEVRAKLSRRAEKLAKQMGYELGSRDYNNLFLKYINPRNVPPSVVENAILSTKGVPGKCLGTFTHETADIRVVVNSSGDVITVVPK